MFDASDFNKLDPKTRAFYQNINLVYLGQLTGYFTTIGYAWYRRRPVGLASINQSYQLNTTGVYDGDRPALLVNSWLYPPDSIPLDNLGLDTLSDAWYWVPLVSPDYPKAKQNVRKSYWTGCARRRRNL